MDIKKSKEQELFKGWRDKILRNGGKGLVLDGIVDEDFYEKCPIKILYILKEVNADKDGWDLRDFIRNGASAKTWNVVSYWTYGILNKFPPFMKLPDEAGGNDFRKRWLKSIAVVNIHKGLGGGSSDWNKIKEFAKIYRDDIRNQINIYNPDIVICGGVGDIVKSIIYPDIFKDWDRTSNGEYFTISDSIRFPLFATYHPQYRIAHNILYTMLIGCIKEYYEKIGA